MSVLELCAIALGGGLGAVLRGLCAHAYNGSWPWGTLLANLGGTAFLSGVMARGLAAEGWWHALLLLGFAGALTTFSSFAVEVAQMWHEERGREAWRYALATVAGCAGVFALAHGLVTALF